MADNKQHAVGAIRMGFPILEMINGFVEPTLNFIKIHQSWGPIIVLVLAFCESLAFLSLLIPASVILWGVGAAIGAAGLEFWPLWLAAATGAVMGDWVSYWIGYHYHHQIAQMWPLKNNPDLLPRGHRLFEKYGVMAVFIGRFFGPLRAVVPLIAGTATMPFLPFQLANISSALVWAAVMLAPGAIGMNWAALGP